MSAEYLRTVIARCPSCARRAPGHVTDIGLDSDVPVWQCPICESTTAPENLDDPEEVDV